MPRVVRPRGEVPVSVSAATRAFGSDLRVRLIRHYLDYPGSQADAARALGVSSANITRNTSLLMEVGVVVVDIGDDQHSRIYQVDRDRLRELQSALDGYLGNR